MDENISAPNLRVRTSRKLPPSHLDCSSFFHRVDTGMYIAAAVRCPHSDKGVVELTDIGPLGIRCGRDGCDGARRSSIASMEMAMSAAYENMESTCAC